MSQIDSSKVSNPGDFTMHYVHLYTFGSDDPVDITDMVSLIEIYESLTSPFLTMDVTILDTIGLIDKAPIAGEELIEIDVRGPDDQVGVIGQGFYVYKLSERIPVSDRGVSYTLHCVSPESIMDMNVKLSRSFKGQPSAIVKELFTTGAIKTPKQVIIQESKNSVSYVSNYWSPLQNVKYLTDRAVAKETLAPSYVFFENKKGFNFVTLDFLVQQSSTYEYYYTINPHAAKANSSSELMLGYKDKIIEHLYVDEAFDYIKRLKSGAMGNRSLFIDPFRKTYQYESYDFVEAFEDYGRLNQIPFNSNSAVRRLNSVFRTHVSPTQAFSSMPTENNREWFRQRLTEIGALSAQTVQIDVPGRFNIYTGNVISLLIFSGLIPDGATDEQSFTSIMDRVLSGRYLVSAIKHSINRKTHVMSLQLNKDSLIKTTL